jgi:hypothetical protein
MSQRITWGLMKRQIGQPIGLTANDPQLLDLANEGIKILWDEGDFIGKNQIFKLKVFPDCHGNKCITFPHAAETIEAINLCNQPIPISTLYFNFQNNAVGELGNRNYGQKNSYPGWRQWQAIPIAGDRSEVVSQKEIPFGGGMKLRIYTERIEPTGRILLLGYDDAGNWIRTQKIGGKFTDGEYLDLSISPVTTLSNFANLTGVQFDFAPRNGNVYLYAVSPDNIECHIGTYDYAMEIPVFRRMILAGLPRWNVFNTEDNQEWTGECVTALVKTRFLPVRFDTDYPQISNISAMKSILKYIYKRDNNEIQEAAAYKEDAITILNKELTQYNGYGSRKTIQFLPRSVVGANNNLF